MVFPMSPGRCPECGALRNRAHLADCPVPRSTAMSGTLILSADPRPPRHRCAPPITDPGTPSRLTNVIGPQSAASDDGKLWRCDCGRYWRAQAYTERIAVWISTGRRRAERTIRRNADRLLTTKETPR